MHDPRSSSHTWIELDQAALRHNLGLFRDRLPRRSRLCFVVKANAYGHGIRPIVACAQRAGLADWFAVHALPEALEVLGMTHLPVLILGYVPLGAVDMAIHPRLRLTVWDPATARALAARGRANGTEVRVHVKVETGTNRHGVHPRDVMDFVRLIDSLPGVVLEGLSTHYANIEDTTDYTYAAAQTRTLLEVRRELAATAGRDLIVHAACSAAALLFPATHGNLVRVGIAGYGLWPSRETLVSAASLPGFTPLRPVLSWRARLSQVKRVAAGAYIGYGLTYRTTRPTVLGVVPVGYAEGYPRALSGIGHVLVRGARAPVRGRVCMNIFMVDLTDTPEASLEDVVTLIGRDGDEEVGAAALAAQSGTIPYEIVARLGASIPRIETGD